MRLKNERRTGTLRHTHTHTHTHRRYAVTLHVVEARGELAQLHARPAQRESGPRCVCAAAQTKETAVEHAAVGTVGTVGVVGVVAAAVGDGGVGCVESVGLPLEALQE